jgi:hypothetical protein
MLTSTRPRQTQVLDLLKLIRPWSMREHHKVRIGNEFDGGYVLPDCALKADLVVSIGVGHDVSFDLDLANRGALIHQYDHTLQKPPCDHAGFRFQRLGWGPRCEGPLVDFAAIHAQAMSAQPRRALLKFDIEGAEYEALGATSAEALAAYEVIACELHDFERLADPAFYASVMQALELLSTHHVPVHLHANNYQSFVLVEGVPIPKVLEVAYLRKDLDSFAGISHDPIPGPLDRPNHPGRPDLCMNPF